MNLLNLNVTMFVALFGSSFIFVPMGIYAGTKNNNWIILQVWGIFAFLVIFLYVAGFLYIGLYTEYFLVANG